MKRLVKDNYVVTVDQKNMMLKANRMGAFSFINRNYNGRELYVVNVQQLIFTWNKLVELGYSVEEMPVSAPKKSLFTMKFDLPNGKQISGRRIWSQEFRRRIDARKDEAYFKLSGKDLRKWHEDNEAEVKAEMKAWEVEYLSQF